MLATCIFAGKGNPSARKFSTVDELVNVIKSAPSSKNPPKTRPLFGNKPAPLPRPRKNPPQSLAPPSLPNPPPQGSAHKVSRPQAHVRGKFLGPRRGGGPDPRDSAPADLARVIV